ncbi:MAG: TetR/AcrR family transcriptional regulator [Mycobacteriaceae bacterium]
MESAFSDSRNTASESDGRKRRWRQHKLQRRTELVDGTLAAIRVRGRDIGMDEIATEIGVSKTVLYRYFADKNDLTNATMMRFLETILIPNLSSAVTAHLGEYELTRTTITVYVNTVASEPEVYPFVMAQRPTSAKGSDAVAESERMIAEMMIVVFTERMRELGGDTSGIEAWAYAIVGAIQLSTHWWMSNQKMTANQLIDYLTMLAWNAIKGILEISGSVEAFTSQPHPTPVPNSLQT